MTRARSKKLKDYQRLVAYESESDKRFFKKMKEIDTARAIVKDLNPRDPETGEVTYLKENKGIIETKLLATQFCVDVIDKIQVNSPLSKHVRVERYPVWSYIDCKVIDKVLSLDESEVLNRGIEPCWWR